MVITLRSADNHHYIVHANIDVYTNTDNDIDQRNIGVCQYCGKTGVARLAIVEFPVEIFHLLRECSPAMERTKSLAILSGQSFYQFYIGTSCLVKFFAQFNDPINQYVHHAIRKSMWRIERYAAKLNRVHALDRTRIADELWTAYGHNAFDHERDQEFDTVEKRVWGKYISRKTILNIRCRAIALLCSVKEQRIALTEARETFRKAIEDQWSKECDWCQRELWSAEAINIGV